MHDRDRYKLLHGPYRMPRCRIGGRLFCEERGWVTVKRISDGKIPWPQTVVRRSRAFILCGGLVKAVRRESAIAVCHWWGVTPQTVSKWRKALGVPQVNEGTARLYRDYAPERLTEEIRKRALAAANGPEANAKKAAFRLGKPAHPRARAALARYWGQSPSAETRRKMSEAHRRRGTRPPKAGQAWMPDEEQLLGRLPDREVAERIGRMQLDFSLCLHLHLRAQPGITSHPAAAARTPDLGGTSTTAQVTAAIIAALD
jgi:hypothetical protein